MPQIMIQLNNEIDEKIKEYMKEKNLSSKADATIKIITDALNNEVK